MYMRVGVMKDYKLKLRKLRVSHTLGFKCVYYESIKRKRVGVMKDYKLKLRKLRVSHTLGWSWDWNT